MRALVPMLWSAIGVFVAARPCSLRCTIALRIWIVPCRSPASRCFSRRFLGLQQKLLVRREPRPGLMASSAIFATGALAALALALTFALEKGWLTIGLALMAPGAAWVAEKRPLPLLRWLAAIMVVVIVARIGYEPRIVGTDLGTDADLQLAVLWLRGSGAFVLGRGMAVAAARRRSAGSHGRCRRHSVHRAARDFRIRHYVTGGDIYRPDFEITEVALNVNAGLAVTIGLERIRGRTGSIVHDAGALLIAALTLWPWFSNSSFVVESAFQQQSGRRDFLQHDPAWLRPAGRARHHVGADRPYNAPDALSRGRRDHRGNACAVLSHARSSPAVSRPNPGRTDHRRGAIRLLDGLARCSASCCLPSALLFARSRRGSSRSASSR